MKSLTAAVLGAHMLTSLVLALFALRLAWASVASSMEAVIEARWVL